MFKQSVGRLHSMARASKWPGQKLLEQQDPPNIAFKEFWDIYKAFRWFDPDRDSTNPGLGKRIEKIVNGGGSRRSKMQEITREFVNLLAELCHGSSSACVYWRDSKCPLLPLRKSIYGAYPCKNGQDYTKVKLGTVNGRLIQLRLHRIVAFLACGHPHPKEALGGCKTVLATHGCGIKGCLRLGCLTWGTHRSNAVDAYEHEHERQLEGSEKTPAT